MMVVLNMRKYASAISNRCNNDHNLFLLYIYITEKSENYVYVHKFKYYAIASLRPFHISRCSGNKGQQKSDWSVLYWSLKLDTDSMADWQLYSVTNVMNWTLQ
jgi:hypothetical protein